MAIMRHELLFIVKICEQFRLLGSWWYYVLRTECYVLVAVVKLLRILEIHLEYVANIGIICYAPVGVDVHPLEATVWKVWLHRPTIQIVGIQIVKVLVRLIGVIVGSHILIVSLILSVATLKTIDGLRLN